LAAVRLAVRNPELAQPPALGLALPLLDDPQGIVPQDACRAQALEIGAFIQRVGAERPDHLHRASPYGGVVVTERRQVESSAQVGHLIIAHAGPDIAHRQVEPREPVLLIEHLGASDEEEVQDVLIPGYVPDEPGNGVETMRTEPHLFITQTLQEISLHLHRQSFMCSTKNSMASMVVSQKGSVPPRGQGFQEVCRIT